MHDLSCRRKVVCASLLAGLVLVAAPAPGRAELRSGGFSAGAAAVVDELADLTLQAARAGDRRDARRFRHALREVLSVLEHHSHHRHHHHRGGHFGAGTAVGNLLEEAAESAASASQPGGGQASSPTVTGPTPQGIPAALARKLAGRVQGSSTAPQATALAGLNLAKFLVRQAEDARRDRADVRRDLRAAVRAMVDARKDRADARRDFRDAQEDRADARMDIADAVKDRAKVRKDLREARKDRADALRDQIDARKDRAQALKAQAHSRATPRPAGTHTGARGSVAGGLHAALRQHQLLTHAGASVGSHNHKR
jgi:hypothetical protein